MSCKAVLDITNALECSLKAHTSHTSVYGGIDASLFVSCRQFRYGRFGVSGGGNTAQESDRNYSIYTYVYVLFIVQ